MPSRAKANVKGVVLCGGEGARLRPLTYYFQKTLLPVGSAQRPVLEYMLRLLRHHGISDVVLLVGYKHEQVMNYFGQGERRFPGARERRSASVRSKSARPNSFLRRS